MNASWLLPGPGNLTPTVSNAVLLVQQAGVEADADAEAEAETEAARDCCGQCANPCQPSRKQGLKCPCGAIICSECYELTRADVHELLRSSAFTFKCDSCRGQQQGGQALVVRKNTACSACRVVFPRPDDNKTLKAQCDKFNRRFCQQCACLALCELRSAAFQNGLVCLTCPSCDGYDIYEEKREHIVLRLLKNILGNQ